MMNVRDRELGMHRDVTRRDFLNGVAVALTSAALAPPWALASGGIAQALAPEQAHTYNYNTLFDPVDWSLSSPDDRACVVGRKQFGRISIANADAAGSSHTDAAIDMAHRAVGEVIESRTRAAVSNLTRSSQ
jgi:hypothetical protein